MQFRNRTRSIAALIIVLVTGSSASAGGRRVIYVMPQQPIRSVTSVQQYQHDDTLSELRNRAAGYSRGLDPAVAADIHNRLLRLEQRQNAGVVVTRDSQNDRPLGLVTVAGIGAAVLDVLKKFESSTTPSTGVDKADAIVAALTPLLAQFTAQNATPAQAGGGGSTPSAADSVPGVPQATVKLGKALETLKAALKDYQEDQIKQNQLQDALKKALKTIDDEIKATLPQETAPVAPPAPTAPPAN